MELNTLYQLLAWQRSHPELLAAADCLLMMPDFFHWCLCGSRVAEFTGFFLLGKLIELDKTEKIFTTPSDKRTEDYITGRFG